jgi:hypothetical protein
VYCPIACPGTGCGTGVMLTVGAACPAPADVGRSCELGSSTGIRHDTERHSGSAAKARSQHS